MIKRKGIKGGLRGKKLPQRRITRHRGKEKSISKLIKEADARFSKEVRMKYAFKPEGSQEWHNICFTCHKVFPVKKLHAGHYLSRFYKSARWDEDNVRPQCMMCNLWKKGDTVVFRQHLVEEIGEERVLNVEAKRHEMIKLKREYIEELIAKLSTDHDLHKRI